MRHDDGTPDDPPRSPDDPTRSPGSPGDDLDAWSTERHRELEAWVEHDREVEAARRHELERTALLARERERRRREAELPPELRDADDAPYDGGPRRRLVMGSSKVLAAVALLAAVAVAVTGFL